MSLGQWSTTAANNATADPAINWQEGQAPSTVNDSARAMMAAIATWFQAPEWINPALTPTYVSANSFTLAGNQTALYAVGRRVRTFNTGGTVYGTISASAYTTLTTVTITPDSGALDSGLSEADVGILNSANTSLGNITAKGNIVASGDITANSDERLKTDWEDVQPQFLESLAAVKSGTFERISTGQRSAGVNAQELRNALPEAVLEGPDGFLSVAYGQAALVAVVELTREVLRLRALLEPVK